MSLCLLNSMKLNMMVQVTPSASCAKMGFQLNWDRGYEYLWAEQTFRLFIILTTVISSEKSMIHSFTLTFGAKYLTRMVTSVPLYETFSL